MILELIALLRRITTGTSLRSFAIYFTLKLLIPSLMCYRTGLLNMDMNGYGCNGLLGIANGKPENSSDLDGNSLTVRIKSFIPTLWIIVL